MKRLSYFVILRPSGSPKASRQQMSCTSITWVLIDSQPPQILLKPPQYLHVTFKSQFDISGVYIFLRLFRCSRQGCSHNAHRCVCN